MAHKLALIGFGTVGQGLAEILLEKADPLREEEGFEAKIVAISDMMKGSLYHPDGLDIRKVLEVTRETGSLEGYPDTPGLIRGWDSFETIEKSNADTIVEITFTDIKTGQPAIDHCRAAFENGKNVVTSNKGPVALAYPELSELARKNGVKWGIEGSVMSGTPALRIPRVSLAGNEIKEIRGILNGTTNYILTKMEEGLTYDEALKKAQELGYAEADPTSDVEGYDALYKVVILANVIMKASLTRDQVERKGITGLTPDDIEQARQEGKRWKLLAEIKKGQDGVRASVSPVKIPLDDPLAGVTDATNAVTYVCDLAGPVTLVGAGAGRTETGFSLLIDLINIERGHL
ncbi:MAG: homoserine dehydrogenase [Bacillaceae bacterium]|nr:homoserine dehydrogenase [Bacillaceae bacterium]